MQEHDVHFSGNPTTLLAITMVAAFLSLALNIWSIARITDLQTLLAIQIIKPEAARAIAGS
jgi:hypothetical protein